MKRKLKKILILLDVLDEVDVEDEIRLKGLYVPGRGEKTRPLILAAGTEQCVDQRK